MRSDHALTTIAIQTFLVVLLPACDNGKESNTDDVGGSSLDVVLEDVQLRDGGTGSSLDVVLEDVQLRDGGTTEDIIEDLGSEGGSSPDFEVLAPLLPASRTSSEHFATAMTCNNCHSNHPDATALRDEAQRPIAPYDLWQASMMANAARDPYWRAQVSVEVQQTPAAAAAIEAKCTRCHAPLAHSEEPLLAEDLEMSMEVLNQRSTRGAIGRDGVSCTVCHLIQAEGLGSPSSFGGGFELARDHQLNAPHDAEMFVAPMVGATGFRTRYAPHMNESKLCATCHTLSTNTLDAEGQATGDLFHEQTPYLEWKNSIFSQEGAAGRSCQGCHMPRVSVDGEELSTAVARSPMGRDFAIDPRSPYGRHLFVGGNTLLPALLRENTAQLKPLASEAAFDALIERTKEQLQEQTASLSFSEPRWEEDLLRFEVQIENRTGHKLPTGYPSRRLWLQLQISDAEGTTLFESGGFNAEGQILNGEGQPLLSERAGGPSLPHKDLIASADEVAIWETICLDSEGRTTFVLLRAASYLKDNRLLPLGWRDDFGDLEMIRPIGVGDDGDFVGGADQVHFEIQIQPREALTITARLLYQSLSARYTAELFEFQTPEVASFKRLMEGADLRPVVVAEISTQLP